jgi:hypothetical protein
MARVHDSITAMDLRAGRLLKEIEKEGLADDTIVFFWADHGQGIPRGKRTLWDTGLRVPLVISFPEKFRHLAPSGPGSASDRLVSLMDLGPTVLSLLGLPVPPGLHGQAFLGRAAAPERDAVFGARDRVDEAAELSRSARDKRFLYIRNFMPDLSWNQPEAFSDQLALRGELARLAADGKLDEAQLSYAGPTKPVEALYDTREDPWQIKNLAADPAFAADLERLRGLLRGWQAETRDLGMIHEWEAARMCRESGGPLAECALDEKRFSSDRALDTAWRVGLPDQAGEFARRLGDPDPTVRYWAAVGLRAAGPEAASAEKALRAAASDGSLSVRVEADGILAKQFGDRAALDDLVALLAGSDEEAAVHAARTVEMLGESARPALPALEAAVAQIKNMYARWSVQGAVARLNGTENPAFQSRAKTADKKKEK